MLKVVHKSTLELYKIVGLLSLSSPLLLHTQHRTLSLSLDCTYPMIFSFTQVYSDKKRALIFSRSTNSIVQIVTPLKILLFIFPFCVWEMTSLLIFFMPLIYQRMPFWNKVYFSLYEHVASF